MNSQDVWLLKCCSASVDKNGTSAKTCRVAIPRRDPCSDSKEFASATLELLVLDLHVVECIQHCHIYPFYHFAVAGRDWTTSEVGIDSSSWVHDWLCSPVIEIALSQQLKKLMHMPSIPFNNMVLLSIHIFQCHWQHPLGQRWTCCELVLRNIEVAEEAFGLDCGGPSSSSPGFPL